MEKIYCYSVYFERHQQPYLYTGYRNQLLYGKEIIIIYYNICIIISIIVYILSNVYIQNICNTVYTQYNTYKTIYNYTKHLIHMYIIKNISHILAYLNIYTAISTLLHEFPEIYVGVYRLGGHYSFKYFPNSSNYVESFIYQWLLINYCLSKGFKL